ncbi:MAG: hypothetical protein K2H07_02715, partial [Lachnospiraceae bacterium]|nr:hypothetical protein [Lachnospiraceae bacterium]
MERRKYLKKAGLYLVLFIVAVASLTGCKRKLRSEKYNEWVKAIGINEYPHVSCYGYYEYDNRIRLVVECYNRESAYDEFKNIIDNHNTFVTRNPDYFSEDFDINITLKDGSEKWMLLFSNRTDSDLDKEYHRDLSVIETEKTHRMRYVYPNDLETVKTKFEAEVIVGSLGMYMLYQTGKARNMSEYFENFDIMVIEISSEVEEKEDLEKIQQANPDAEIYYII